MSIKDVYELGSLLSFEETELQELEGVIRDVSHQIQEQENQLSLETDQIEESKCLAVEQRDSMRSLLADSRLLSDDITNALNVRRGDYESATLLAHIESFKIDSDNLYTALEQLADTSTEIRKKADEAQCTHAKYHERKQFATDGLNRAIAAEQGLREDLRSAHAQHEERVQELAVAHARQEDLCTRLCVLKTSVQEQRGQEGWTSLSLTHTLSLSFSHTHTHIHHHQVITRWTHVL